MKIQRTDWGYIEWRHIHDENDKKQLIAFCPSLFVVSAFSKNRKTL